MSHSTLRYIQEHVAHDMRSILRCRTRHPYLRSFPTYFYQRLAKKCRVRFICFLTCQTGRRHISHVVSGPGTQTTYISHPSLHSTFPHMWSPGYFNTTTTIFHVDSGFNVAPTISLCQVRSRFPYVLCDMSSPDQLP